MKMNKFVDVLVDIATTMHRAGAKVTNDKNKTRYQLGSKTLTFIKPTLIISFMGSPVQEVKGWPYYSVQLNNGTSFSFESKLVTQEMIDAIASFIDQLREELLIKTKKSPVIEDAMINAYRHLLDNRTRESYLLFKTTRKLFLEECEYHKQRRREKDNKKSASIEMLFEIKRQIPHSLTLAKGKGVKVTKSFGGYRAEHKGVFASGGFNEYHAVRLLESRLREEITNFGHDRGTWLQLNEEVPYLFSESKSKFEDLICLKS